jgi:hypothetical protein
LIALELHVAPTVMAASPNLHYVDGSANSLFVVRLRGAGTSSFDKMLVSTDVS